MTVSPDARTPSASVHALSASTPSGAARPLQVSGIATAPTALAELPETFAPLGDAAAAVAAATVKREVELPQIGLSLGRDAVCLGPEAQCFVPSQTGKDPLVAMHREASASLSRLLFGADDGSENDATFSRLASLREAAFKTVPTGLPGALAALEWARMEFASYYIDPQVEGEVPDWLDRFTLHLLDSASAVLRPFALDAPASSDDAPLLAAVAEFCRLDDLQGHLCRTHDADTDDIPGYAETEAPWFAWLDQVAARPALTWEGIVAKAETVKRHTVDAISGPPESIAASIIEDVLRLAGRTWDERSNRVPASVVRALVERAA